jgi:PHP family Zn ribbon phosphoesterase
MGIYNILKGLTNPAGVLWEGNRRLRTKGKNRVRIQTIQIALENGDLLILIQPCHHLRAFFPLVSHPPGVLG